MAAVNFLLSITFHHGANGTEKFDVHRKKSKNPSVFVSGISILLYLNKVQRSAGKRMCHRQETMVTRQVLSHWLYDWESGQISCWPHRNVITHTTGKKLLVSLKVFQRSSMKKLCVAVPSPSECRECLIDRNTHNLAHDVDAFHICSAYATSKHTIGENGHTQANITNFSVSSKAFEFDDKPNVGLMKHEFHTINCIACVRQHTTFVP